MRGKRTFAAAAFVSCVLGAPVAAQAPLSAIDWLSDVTTTPLPVPQVTGPLAEEEVSRGISNETILVTPLDAPNADAVGLLPRDVSGLPRDLWGPSTTDELRSILAQIEIDDLLPATRDLLFTLLLAELDAPLDSAGTGAFLLARTDTLTRLGAVEQAYAMLDRAGVTSVDHFAQWFDLSVYLDRETQACDLLASDARLSNDLSIRIFCLARAGDWPAAALSFDTARALGMLEAKTETLLLRFLDVEADEGPAHLPIPDDPSPLVFQLFEAIGEPLPTTALPLPFAHTDLRFTAGWKAQVEAAERLVAVGALPANQLLGLYTERQPAASGGVWDRVDAVQTLDLAISSGNTDAVTMSLPIVWDMAQQEDLTSAISDLYAARLRLFDLASEVDRIVFLAGLLTDDYETSARSRTARDAQEQLLIGIATGELDGLSASTPMGASILEAFTSIGPSDRFAHDVEQRAIGAALLRAIDLLGAGRNGDLGKVTDTLTLLRFLGLDRVARRTALELLILEPRG